MPPQDGHIEIERSVSSIQVGHRHRRDLGNLDELAASIERLGLLQPVTVTPDGLLVCGARRLAAIKQLGWQKINVWVRSGLSDKLGQLLSEQEDNVLAKPLTPLEAAELYREVKLVMAEDAARRKEGTQFSSEHQPGSDGPGKCPAPSTSLGDAREQAAAMIPGGTSYKTLEKIGYLDRIANDPTQPESVREQIAEGLARIEAGAPVHPIYEAVRDLVEPQARQEALHQLATDALARVATDKKAQRSRRPTAVSGTPDRYPVKAFTMTWASLDKWWEHYDADELATKLTDEQFDQFVHTVDGTVVFAGQLQSARTPEPGNEPDAPPRLHVV